MTITLTDGGIETRIIYEFKHAIGDFESFELLENESGRNILRQIYQSYADVAVRYGLPIQLGTPTWRASRKWTSEFIRVNAEAVELLREVTYRAARTRIILAGVIGPASDGYTTREALKEDDAFAYHYDQAGTLAARDVDLLYAPTFPAFSELYGVARAMAKTGRPYALAPMLHPDGSMLDRTPLAEANRAHRWRRLAGTAALYDRLPLSHPRANGAAGTTCRTTESRYARSRIESERVTSLAGRAR
jgi:S-methylmethionine-dependent homocysteine/selenocysteine methylase